MKLETGTIIAKGLCYVCIGGLTPLGVGLAQWANSGEWPSRIVWVVIIASCIVGGATQLLSFLSGSYSNYAANRAAGNGATDLPQVIQPPAASAQPAQQNKP